MYTFYLNVYVIYIYIIFNLVLFESIGRANFLIFTDIIIGKI